MIENDEQDPGTGGVSVNAPTMARAGWEIVRAIACYGAATGLTRVALGLRGASIVVMSGAKRIATAEARRRLITIDQGAAERMIQDAAARRGIDPDMLRAMINQHLGADLLPEASR